MNRHLTNRIARLEQQHPSIKPRRQLDLMLIDWLRFHPEAQEPFDGLLRMMSEEELEELHAELRFSIERGYDDYRRHEDTEYLNALRIACDHVNAREAMGARVLFAYFPRCYRERSRGPGRSWLRWGIIP